MNETELLRKIEELEFEISQLQNKLLILEAERAIRNIPIVPQCPYQPPASPSPWKWPSDSWREPRTGDPLPYLGSTVSGGYSLDGNDPNLFYTI